MQPRTLTKSNNNEREGSIKVTGQGRASGLLHRFEGACFHKKEAKILEFLVHTVFTKRMLRHWNSSYTALYLTLNW